LTEEETRVIHLLAEGMTLAEIADRIGSNRNQAAHLCNHVKAKLGMASLSDLLRYVVLTDGFQTHRPA
jgi:DNA-binding CsgD family transcriptional regulator